MYICATESKIVTRTLGRSRICPRNFCNDLGLQKGTFKKQLQRLWQKSTILHKFRMIVLQKLLSRRTIRKRLWQGMGKWVSVQDLLCNTPTFFTLAHLKNVSDFCYFEYTQTAQQLFFKALHNTVCSKFISASEPLRCHISRPQGICKAL